MFGCSLAIDSNDSYLAAVTADIPEAASTSVRIYEFGRHPAQARPVSNPGAHGSSSSRQGNICLCISTGTAKSIHQACRWMLTLQDDDSDADDDAGDEEEEDEAEQVHLILQT